MDGSSAKSSTDASSEDTSETSPTPAGPISQPDRGCLRPAFILSDGAYTVFLSPAGTGFSSAGGYALHHWSGDRVEDRDGFHLYLRDLDSGVFWSAGRQPVPGPSGTSRVRFTPGRFRLERRTEGLETLLEVCVPPGEGLELRRLELRNLSGRRRRIEATSLIEVILNSPAAHAAHPVFSKLFLQTECSAGGRVLFCRRRPRAGNEAHPWAFHALFGGGNPSFETDRARFLGRSGSVGAPRALSLREPLSGTAGSVLDPVFSLRTTLDLEAGGSGELLFLLGVAPDREAAERAATRIAASRLEPLFEAAEREAGDCLETEGLTGKEAEKLHALAGALLQGQPGIAAPRSRRTWAYWSRLGLSIPGENGDGNGSSEEGALPDVSGLISNEGSPAPGAPPGEPPPPERPRAGADRAPETAPDDPLRFFNGLGGFSSDGREYVIRVGGPENTRPPQPWINVLANEQFGCLISESGAGTTWSGNSREFRLTPWFNDPVLDPHGEAFYLRDEETGTFWSLLPGPTPPPAATYEMRHGLGYSRCSLTGQDLEQETTVFVPRSDAVKITTVRLVNTGSRPRRLALFAFHHLVLGGAAGARATVVTGIDPGTGTLFARNPGGGNCVDGVTYAAAFSPGPVRSASRTADREAFIGRYGTPAAPAALRIPGALEEFTGAGLDPAFAQQVVVDLPAGGTAEVHVLLGQATGSDEALAVIAHFAEPVAVRAAFEETRRFWSHPASVIRVETPSPALDIMVNGWLPYQTLACRIWGRSAFYQSGGAFGFRDQLQDAASLVLLWPGITRQQILLNAAHQFVEGDVLHWWHPPDSRGIRTRFADDLLWLPLLAAQYIAATGDEGLLDERAPYLAAPPLQTGEDEVFLTPLKSGLSGDVYEHCCRAIDRSLVTGAHGLPLFGTGDWNDGMNRVGRQGRGESVWMGFFLYQVLGEFLSLCEIRQDRERIDRYGAHRESLRRALNAGGWDGEWYRRGFYDDGSPLGSASSDECRIDALVQAWAVLSGAAPPDRAALAMDAVLTHLVSEEEGLIRLLTPPFDRTAHDPGYIKGYVPGVRENGGQYTHAALWVVRALAGLGRNNKAMALLDMLNPIHRAGTPEQVAVYRVEPYVVAADVYGAPPHVGRGGWTWYTGSSGWMYRVALESILGLSIRQGRTLVLSPCVPDDWPRFSLSFAPPGGDTRYDIVAHNPHRRGLGVASATLDGEPLPVADGETRVPLERDGCVHQIEVVLGRAEA